ncbi:hypothetical protein FA13DRAFT_93366 [Coprinellus micaceus]|uniref:Uncharacterized protein n=1 Tax=Coprinellus micaceus TaxID=71717 RepID=A0A4Y7SIW1_COPMI|nr:hypothetical protein FA13DRAFT_93366 [Coprinellus micaceus]
MKRLPHSRAPALPLGDHRRIHRHAKIVPEHPPEPFWNHLLPPSPSPSIYTPRIEALEIFPSCSSPSPMLARLPDEPPPSKSNKRLSRHCF